jgi:hypothetical protein
MTLSTWALLLHIYVHCDLPTGTTLQSWQWMQFYIQYPFQTELFRRRVHMSDSRYLRYAPCIIYEVQEHTK